jgi:hypothetical protein
MYYFYSKFSPKAIYTHIISFRAVSSLTSSPLSELIRKREHLKQSNMYYTFLYPISIQPFPAIKIEKFVQIRVPHVEKPRGANNQTIWRTF